MQQGDMRGDINLIAAAVHDNAKEKGFWDDVKLLNELRTGGVVSSEESAMLHSRLLASRLALISSEVSEALEELRNGNIHLEADELADIIIRVLDYAHYRHIDIRQAVISKMQLNRNREHMHGGKRL